jgi:hypothetical protein
MTENEDSNLPSVCLPHLNFDATHYRSGDEIQAGDRICWGGKAGYVVFVCGSSNSPENWADSIEWLAKEYGEGLMLDTESAGLVFAGESNEDLESGGRKT